MPMFNDRSLDYQYDDLQNMDEWSFKADFVSAVTGHSLMEQPTYTSSQSILMSESDPILPNDTFTQLSSQQPIKLIKHEIDYETTVEDWKNKSVDTWNSPDVSYWLAAEAQRLGIAPPEIGIDRFAAAGIDGIRLQSMTEQDFCNLNRLYGNTIYCSLQSYRAETERSNFQYENMFQLPLDEPTNLPHYDTSLPPPLDSHVLTNLDTETRLSSSSSNESRTTHYETSYHRHSGTLSPDNESGSDSGFESERPPEKRKPGRPRGTRRKKKPEKLGRLWEFIRDLLKNREYCPSLICWDNYDEGMFRFVHSDKVAKLWGSKKDNPEMNYEKLSRAMRYYYKSKVLQPVLGRRLVYKFGPTATGWRMENPIFARSN